MPMPTGGWRDRLRPASFRGVGFKVDVSTYVGGRRTVPHEYAKRDTPSTEDMGRRIRRYPVIAHIVGENYDLDRDALIAALEAGGPGTLVHPYHGEVQVNVDQAPFSIIERAERGRMCEIEVTFIEAGDTATATPSTNTASAATSSVATANSATSSAVDATLSAQQSGTTTV